MNPPDDLWRIGFDDDQPNVVLGPVEVSAQTCWHCGRPVEASRMACPSCGARLVSEADVVREDRGDGPVDVASSISTMLYVYIGLLCLSVAVGWMNGFGLIEKGPPGPETDGRQLMIMLILEAVGACVVFAGIAWSSRPPALSPISLGRKVLVWLAAIPLLAALMAMNFAYMHVLKTGLGLPDATIEMAQRPEMFFGVLLAYCIQPAIVEEFFFRYLALGHLKTIVGTSGAVLVSGVMFGLAHIGNPLAIPYLIVLGLVLGIIRVAGRSMLIPIVLHFAHNAIVVWLEPLI